LSVHEKRGREGRREKWENEERDREIDRESERERD
jgi:hypothetical protein